MFANSIRARAHSHGHAHDCGHAHARGCCHGHEDTYVAIKAYIKYCQILQ